MRAHAVHQVGTTKEAPLPRRTRTALAVVAVGAVLAAGCAGDGGDEGSTRSAAAAPATTTGGGGGRGGYGDRSEPTSSRGGATDDGDTDDVRIADFAFDPPTVSAKVGQRIKWEHQDAGVTHTVAALDGAFRSGKLEEGDEFSHLFPRAGTFAYRCTIHTDMRGTVKVAG